MVKAVVGFPLNHKPLFVTHEAHFHPSQVIKWCLKNNGITPLAGKFGLSLEGGFSAVCSKDYPIFLFDFYDVKPYIKPVFYFGMARYHWFDLNGFSTTFYQLLWETELRGSTEKLPLDLCKAVIVPKRFHKLGGILSSRFELLPKLPDGPIQRFAVDVFNTLQKGGHALFYNKYLAKLFGLDYELVEKKVVEIMLTNPFLRATGWLNENMNLGGSAGYYG